MQSELWLQGQALARTGQVIYGGEAKVLDASVDVSSVLRLSVGRESEGSKTSRTSAYTVCSCTPALAGELFLLFIPRPSSFSSPLPCVLSRTLSLALPAAASPKCLAVFMSPS